MEKYIKILPKFYFDEHVCDKLISDNIDHSVYISILDPDNDEKLYKTSENFLQVYMWDVEKDVHAAKVNKFYKKPTDTELIKIIDFTDRHKNKENFIIHCSAGISRSGAVGRFIQEILDLDSKKFYRDNPHIKPNLYILKRLRELYKQENNVV